MYSVVIMMAMTGAPETPACHGFMSSMFCCAKTYCGCSGSYGRYGSGYGCYGSGYGCYGSGYGCYGSSAYSSWGYGGCTGYGVYGGATYGWPVPAVGGCGGCYGYGYNYGMAPSYGTAPAYGTVAPYGVAPSSPRVEEIPAPKKDTIKGGTSYVPQAPGQARVIVLLPADAKLYADGMETTLTSAERNFVTPVLEKGRDFQYLMKVEYQRGGRTVVESRKVLVRSDAVVRVDFTETNRPEMVSSKVTVALPQGAKLFVDGQAKEVPAQGEFHTPELIKGAEYVYMFKAELNTDGNKQAQTQRVIFKAGEAVRVDFSDLVNTSRVTLK